jgi:TM2 domain-containing membrane protein YozV
MPTSREPLPLAHDYSPWAGLLSLLVPGLGQIYLGRFGKGLLFLVCLYGLFFYGMALGDWKNVYLPETAKESNPWKLPSPLANVYNRLHYAGQFWIGIAAWPALWQYNQLPVPTEETSPFWHNFQRTPSEAVLNEKQTDGDKTWDLGWVFTVIAGVLNILVIYDAFAGPAFRELELEVRPQQEAVHA